MLTKSLYQPLLNMVKKPEPQNDPFEVKPIDKTKIFKFGMIEKSKIKPVELLLLNSSKIKRASHRRPTKRG